MRDHFTGVELARKMSAITAVFFISPIIAPQLGTLLALVAGWRHVFWIPGTISALSLVIAWRMLKESHAVTRRRRSSLANMWGTVTEIVRHPLSGPCLLIQAGMSFGLMTWISASSMVLTGYYSVPERYFGLYFAATASVQLAGSIACNRLLRRFNPSFVLALGGASGVLGGILVLLVAVTGSGPFWLLMAGVWLFVIGFGMTVPASSGMALHAFGAVGGLAAAVLGSAQALVGSLGSFLSAALYDGTPLALGICLALATSVAAMTAWKLGLRLHRQPELLDDPD
jgi:DHA1 family bicyclomycin/chloramphenicol resistance-like MFS transporter